LGCKGKSKAIEVPPHVSFSQAEVLLAAFPGEERLIQEVLMEPPSPSPCPPSTSGQKHTHSDAGLTPEAKHVLSPPQAPHQEPVVKSPPPPSPCLVDIVEDVKMPEIFSDASTEDFKLFLDKVIKIFRVIGNVSQDQEASTFLVLGTTVMLTPARS
jgi:hypothetical protein